MKKVLYILIFIIFVTGSVFAQPDDIHWVSSEISFIGIGMRYEYMLSTDISIGTNIYFNEGLINGAGGINVIGCYYPWENTFFLEFGFGFGFVSGSGETILTHKTTNETIIHTGITTLGIAVTPGFGWRIKIDFITEGFFLQTGFKFPIGMGKQRPRETSMHENTNDYSLSTYNFNERIGSGSAFIFYLGVGYAFYSFDDFFY